MAFVDCSCSRKTPRRLVTVSTRNNSWDDHGWRWTPSAAVTDKGTLQLSLFRVVLCPQGRSWAMVGPVPNYSCQRPLATHIHRGDNRCHDSMAYFSARGKGGLHRRIRGIIVDVFAVIAVSTTGQVR